MASNKKRQLNEPLVEEEFCLEDILAEYGGSRGQKLMEAVERSVDHTEEEPPKPPKRPRGETDISKDLPKAPRPISLEQMVGNTVDAVMEERREEEPILQPRKGLFSRRKAEEDTERLFEPPEPEEELTEADEIGEEPDLRTAAADAREDYKTRSAMLLPAFFLALIPTALLALEEQGILIPLWSGRPKNQAIVLLVCLVLSAILCRGVFAKVLERLREKRCTSEVLVAAAAAAAMGDCVVRFVSAARADVTPYAAVSCLALFFAQLGNTRLDRGYFDTFRAASMDDEPPYLIAETERAACKQRGAVFGFYTTAQRTDDSVLAQTVLLPLLGVAAVVFAGLTSLGKGRGSDFLLHLSIILSGAAGFVLPLCFSLPWARLARHLQKAGCAVAGFQGAEKISRRKCMILTDTDLFPPGAVQLNGMKIYGEERWKVVSYAASMARAADCGLGRLFTEVLRSEMGDHLKVDQFAFYEEGGYAGTIRGESVLLGTASFMRKMDVRLPGDINLKTGIFLAVDKELVAVFAVKYNPSENVDFALKMLRKNSVSTILATRDPNVTPALLKRKFGKRTRMEYPNLMVRVALSEAGKDRDLPRALLFREGLLPYAETVVGSRRMVRTVRWNTLISLAGSVAGTLLTAYLASVGGYALMSPLTLEAFLLLWTAPVVLLSDLSARY
ncbi:MAG: hypothetical protein IJE22_05895 [Oscillibacter sp.]|nr:hypothetical protein [Oscillibacter sp.]MBQ2996741.1 hypothetical protein [Oscillibacter sp.]